jgi:hypothetical protein
MAFNFSLTNVTSAANFKSDDVRKLNSLNTYGEDRDVELYTYPLDLGNTDKAHFMMFSIFEQEVTQFKGNQSGSKQYGAKDSSGLMRNISQGQVDIGTLQSQGVTPNAGKSLNDLTSVAGDIGNEALNGARIGDAFVRKTFGLNGPRTDAFVNTAVPIAEGVLLGDAKQITQEAKRTDASNFNRKIKRIKETVALYLPDSLTFDYNQGYSDVGMYADKVGLGAVAASAVKEMSAYTSYQNSAEMIAKIAGKNLSPFISRALGSVGGAGKVVASTLLGGVENPMLELLYTQPEFRSFRFDFMFYPRSVAESEEVHRIINCFKFHSSPEIKPGSAGFFLVPPSVFNIEFYYNGEINPNLPTISDCVCTSVSVDYAPSGSGWSAYEIPGPSVKPTVGGNGAPFSIRLSLAFKETIILTKGLYNIQGMSKRENR